MARWITYRYDGYCPGRYLDYVKAKIVTEFQEKTKEDLVLQNVLTGSVIWIKNVDTSEVILRRHNRKGDAKFKMGLLGKKNKIIIRVRKASGNEAFFPIEIKTEFFKGSKPYIIRQERDRQCD